MVRVKICGITNLADARASVDAGCSALGFVFYKKSPRYVAPEKAAGIIKNLPKSIVKVGVFVDAREETIKRIARLCRLDMLQFHGDEPPEFCRKFKDYKVIKAFRIKDKLDLGNILRYNTFAYLFDTFARANQGGTGKSFNWVLLRRLGRLKPDIFLSGGLNVRNVREAIKIVRPEWVDVSSSLEIRPGKKGRGKIKNFMQAVKSGR